MGLDEFGKPRWFFYAAWVCLSVVGFAAAWPLCWVVISLAKTVVGDAIWVAGQRHITEDFLLQIVYWPAVGLFTGLLQYLLLRTYLPRMGRWVAASFLGWALAFPASDLVYDLLSPAYRGAVWSVVLRTALVGGFIGLAQWPVLRGRVRWAGLWIPATVLGWEAVAVLTDGAASGLSGVLALVLVPSVVTAVALWALPLPLEDEGEGGDG